MMPSNMLISGPAVEAAQILILSYLCVFLPPMSTAMRTSGSSQCPFICSIDTVCLIDHVDLIQLVHLVGRFGVFFLSHTAPGFQLWFYFHLCMWVMHWGLLLRLPWKTWVCPCEGQMWKWYSCLGCRGSGNTRYSGELAARAVGNNAL